MGPLLGAVCAALLAASVSQATELRIPLAGAAPIERHQARFQCDAEGARLGLPAGLFTVTYLNGAGNSLAVLPLGGVSLVMAGVASADGARYAAERYVWWDVGGRGATLYLDWPGGRRHASCRRASTG